MYLCMHQFVCRARPQLHDFEWLLAVALQYDVGQRQLADTHAIHVLDSLRTRVAHSLRTRLLLPDNMPISRDPLPRWDRPACASLVSISRD